MTKLKEYLKAIPVIGAMAQRFYLKFIKPPKKFTNSNEYWVARYQSGGNSGGGSYDRLAEFKAEVVNDFVSENGITSVIEYGCGDGNQLSLMRYPEYRGFDISPDAIDRCRELFEGDTTKSFKLMEKYQNETASLTISLDVIFHLVEDAVFIDYMNRLFESSERFVVIYSSNTDKNDTGLAKHVRHRMFSDWIAENKKDWKLLKHIPNKYPYESDDSRGSFADFYIYKKTLIE